MAAHVGGGEAAERVAAGCIRVSRHGADYGLKILLLFQAAGVRLGLAWRGAVGGGGALGRGERQGQGAGAGRGGAIAGAGRLPGEGAFWALNRPTTPLPCRPPERSNTALERPLRQQTTGKRFWR